MESPFDLPGSELSDVLREIWINADEMERIPSGEEAAEEPIVPAVSNNQLFIESGIEEFFDVGNNQLIIPQDVSPMSNGSPSDIQMDVVSSASHNNDPTPDIVFNDSRSIANPESPDQLVTWSPPSSPITEAQHFNNHVPQRFLNHYIPPQPLHFTNVFNHSLNTIPQPDHSFYAPFSMPRFDLNTPPVQTTVPQNGFTESITNNQKVNVEPNNKMSGQMTPENYFIPTMRFSKEVNKEFKSSLENRSPMISALLHTAPMKEIPTNRSVQIEVNDHINSFNTPMPMKRICKVDNRNRNVRNKVVQNNQTPPNRTRMETPITVTIDDDIEEVMVPTNYTKKTFLQSQPCYYDVYKPPIIVDNNPDQLNFNGISHTVQQSERVRTKPVSTLVNNCQIVHSRSKETQTIGPVFEFPKMDDWTSCEGEVVKHRPHLCAQSRVIIARVLAYNCEMSKRLGNKAGNTPFANPEALTASMTGFKINAIRQCSKRDLVKCNSRVETTPAPKLKPVPVYEEKVAINNSPAPKTTKEDSKLRRSERVHKQSSRFSSGDFETCFDTDEVSTRRTSTRCTRNSTRNKDVDPLKYAEDVIRQNDEKAVKELVDQMVLVVSSSIEGVPLTTSRKRKVGRQSKRLN